jgi:hypothetical protein
MPLFKFAAAAVFAVAVFAVTDTRSHASTTQNVIFNPNEK